MTNTKPINQMEEKIKQLIAELEERVINYKMSYSIPDTYKITELELVINRLNNILKGE